MTATPAALDPPTILIVDDYRPNLIALEAALAPLGFPTTAAESGEEALRYAAEQDFAIVLVDVHMPGLDGYQTVERLQKIKHSRGVPVVFLTAEYDRPEHAHRGYALGAVDYIVKPVDPIALRAKVNALAKLYVRGQAVEREKNQRLERMKDLVLGAVGHDLRNPLHAILLSARMLTGAPCEQEAHRSYGARIERAASRMDGMIERIVDVTRVHLAGGIALEVERADLGNICRAMVSEAQAAHPERAFDLEAQGDIAGTWDRARLERVVSNLLANAAEHGNGAAVRVAVVGSADRVLLSVHNGGPPVPAELLPVMFDPFKRGGTRGKGLGLGLFIVREIVAAHGGSVDVTSAIGAGTTFTVSLPRQIPARTSATS